MSTNPYRLPRTVVPRRYTLALQPDLAAASFTGSVIIDAEATAGTDAILLNADELDIHAVQVNGSSATFHLEQSTERLVVDGPIAQGPCTIEIAFTGVLNDKLRGWYRSTYRDADGTEHVIATSQMQSTDCRRAFPCFDEPDFKAVFDITLIVQPHLLAISNAPEAERTEQPDGTVAVRFAPTMPMSTYLVALVVGPLEATEPTMVPRLGGGHIPLRIVHVPGKAHLTDFGIEAGAFALEWFQEFYGIAYPTEKCDMVALPDFAAGAMENLGCITYRENLLLVDPDKGTQFERQTLADVVHHELAHMWFGDLVTMKWWNGIWLNEAFATFMEIACCDAFRPDWLRWTTFSLERSMAFEVDSLASTRTVEYPVEAPDDCDGMFDVLTYQKGGSLLRMLQQYLGEDGFRAGVSLYLRRHALANTETSDLWDALEDANPATPVRRLMDSWIWQAGYPLVSARQSGTSLVLQQQRFAFGDTEDATLFVAPVHLRIDGVESKVLLDNDELVIELPSASAAVVVNSGGHGYMRVAYDSALRSRLAGELSSLTIIDRYNLVDDAWNEVVAGRLGANDFLEFVAGFDQERELAVWQAITAGLRGVGRLVDLGTPAHDQFRQRVSALVSPVLAEVQWTPTPGESDLRAKLRGLLLGALATLAGDTTAQQYCREVLERSDADPELFSAATSAVAACGTDADFDRFVEGFRTATTPQDMLRNLYALAEFPEQRHIERAVEFAFSGEVKTQNAPFLVNRCIANRAHGATAWKLLRQRWDEANEKFPSNTIVRMVDPVKLLNTDDVAADVQSFFSEHPIPQGAKTLDQILERQRVNAAIREREHDTLTQSLNH